MLMLMPVICTPLYDAHFPKYLLSILMRWGQIFECFHVVPDMYIYIESTEEIAYLMHSDMFLNLLKFPFA